VQLGDLTLSVANGSHLWSIGVTIHFQVTEIAKPHIITFSSPRAENGGFRALLWVIGGDCGFNTRLGVCYRMSQFNTRSLGILQWNEYFTTDWRILQNSEVSYGNSYSIIGSEALSYRLSLTRYLMQ
jgi:hypothetical protein